ncbi:MAG: hypothetical protein DRH37_11375, partial [Deltaproteobacteria bacterium]
TETTETESKVETDADERIVASKDDAVKLEAEAQKDVDAEKITEEKAVVAEPVASTNNIFDIVRNSLRNK